MQPSLQGIAQKARRLKKYRFRDLYRMLNVDMLRAAWRAINKNAAAGVDRVTAEEYGREIEKHIAETVGSLKEKRYRAKLVRRVNIPKGDGRTRPLGIPAISDKLVQMVVGWILMAIYEQDFMKCSYGYRPNIGAKDAVRDLTKELQFGRYNYVMEADVKGYFESINHEWLIRMMEERIDDKAFTELIRKWLKAGILEEDGKVIHPETGTPQGGIVSPVLANIYLHYALDLWFEKVVRPRCEGAAYLCRYADDFVCTFQYRKDAERFYHTLKERLRKFGLELSEEKTNVIPFSRFHKEERTWFEFLGFEFWWGTSRKGKDIIKRRTSRKKLRKSLKDISCWCKSVRSIRLKGIIELLNVKLRGYYNYYGVIGNYRGLDEFFYQVKKMLFKWLNRRSQKRSYNWEKFNRMLRIYRLEVPRITEGRSSQLNLRFCRA
jgi:group II intron reverse transcriptase/maturase